MKKIILAASMLAFYMGANAQDMGVTTTTTTTTTDRIVLGKDYKPVQGDVLAEIGLFGGDIVNLPASTFGTPQLKFRYFLQDKLALRVGFNLTQQSSTTKFYEPAPGSGDGYARTMNSLFGINAGVEKHFAGTGRLSTYVGADASVQFTGAASKWENTTDGVTYTADASRKVTGTNANGNRSFGTGLRVITGADYYFVEKVYLGAEFGWGFMAVVDGKTKTETTVGGVTTTVETKSTGSEFNLMPSLTAGVRIGYRF